MTEHNTDRRKFWGTFLVGSMITGGLGIRYLYHKYMIKCNEKKKLDDQLKLELKNQESKVIDVVSNKNPESIKKELMDKFMHGVNMESMGMMIEFFKLMYDNCQNQEERDRLVQQLFSTILSEYLQKQVQDKMIAALVCHLKSIGYSNTSGYYVILNELCSEGSDELDLIVKSNLPRLNFNNKMVVTLLCTLIEVNNIELVLHYWHTSINKKLLIQEEKERIVDSIICNGDINLVQHFFDETNANTLMTLDEFTKYVKTNPDSFKMAFSSFNKKMIELIMMIIKPKVNARLFHAFVKIVTNVENPDYEVIADQTINFLNECIGENVGKSICMVKSEDDDKEIDPNDLSNSQFVEQGIDDENSSVFLNLVEIHRSLIELTNFMISEDEPGVSNRIIDWIEKNRNDYYNRWNIHLQRRNR